MDVQVGESLSKFALKQSGTRWDGTIGPLSAQRSYVLHVHAFDQKRRLVRVGTVSGVSVVTGRTTLATVFLQDPLSNIAQVIHGLALTPAESAIDSSLQLQVFAGEDTPISSTHWTASRGALDDLNNQTRWFPPALSGSASLTLVMSSQKQVWRASFELQTLGNRSVQWNGANLWPVLAPLPELASIAPGDTQALKATAFDDDKLAVQWRSSCGGRFEPSHSLEATFVSPSTSPVTGVCSLTLRVSDGRGGTASASRTFSFKPIPRSNRPPVFLKTLPRVGVVQAGGRLRLLAKAHDPEGGSLRFQWKANKGTLSTESSSPNESHQLWQAPSGSCEATVTVIVMDSEGASNQHTFRVRCPQHTWATQWGDLIPRHFVQDKNENTYVCGAFKYSRVIGGRTFTTRGERDLFVFKVNAKLELEWVHQVGGGQLDQCLRMAVDYRGDLYMAGQVSSAVKFGSIPFEPGPMEQDERRNILAKLSPSGRWLWVKDIGRSGGGYTQIETDGRGNLYVAGALDLRERFQLGSFVLHDKPTTTIARSLFFAKLGPNAKWLWAKRPPGESYNQDQNRTLAVDSSGNVYVAGEFQNTLKLGSYTLQAKSNISGFVAKLTPQGEWLWALATSPSTQNAVLGLALDSQGNPYLVGSYASAMVLGTTTLQVKDEGGLFVAGLTPQGKWRWAVGGAGPASYVFPYYASIAYHPRGELYIGGQYDMSARFGSISIAGVGNCGFIAKLNTQGQWLGAKSIETRARDRVEFLRTNVFGDLLVLGYFGVEGPSNQRITLAGVRLTFPGMFVASVDF